VLGPTFSQYLRQQWPHIQPLVWEQVTLIATAMVLSAASCRRPSGSPSAGWSGTGRAGPHFSSASPALC